MALGSKDTIAALTAVKDFLEKQVEELREEKKELQKQVSNLQDALIAVSNKESYSMIQTDRASLNWESNAEKDIKDHVPDEEYRAYKEYQSSLDSPLFNSSDEFLNLIDTLGAARGAPESKPVHNNEES